MLLGFCPLSLSSLRSFPRTSLTRVKRLCVVLYHHFCCCYVLSQDHHQRLRCQHHHYRLRFQLRRRWVRRVVRDSNDQFLYPPSPPPPPPHPPTLLPPTIFDFFLLIKNLTPPTLPGQTKDTRIKDGVRGSVVTVRPRGGHWLGSREFESHASTAFSLSRREERRKTGD